MRIPIFRSSSLPMWPLTMILTASPMFIRAVLPVDAGHRQSSRAGGNDKPRACCLRRGGRSTTERRPAMRVRAIGMSATIGCDFMVLPSLEKVTEVFIASFPVRGANPVPTAEDCCYLGEFALADPAAHDTVQIAMILQRAAMAESLPPAPQSADCFGFSRSMASRECPIHSALPP